MLSKLLRIRSLKALSNRFPYYLVSHSEDYGDCYYSGLEDGMAGTNKLHAVNCHIPSSRE